MNKETITITNKEGEKLVGDHYRAADNKKVIICVHGYATNRRYSAGLFAQYLAENGRNTINIDLSGNGESEGLHEEKTITNWKDDILCVFEYAKSLGYKHLALATSSMSNMHGLLAASEEPAIERIFCYAPSLNFVERNELAYDEDWEKEWKEKGYKIKHTEKEDFKSNYALVENARTLNFRDYFPEIKAETLLIYGDQDKHVAPQLIKEAVNLMPNCSAVVIEGVEHPANEKSLPHIKELLDKFFADW